MYGTNRPFSRWTPRVFGRDAVCPSRPRLETVFVLRAVPVLGGLHQAQLMVWTQENLTKKYLKMIIRKSKLTKITPFKSLKYYYDKCLGIVKSSNYRILINIEYFRPYRDWWKTNYVGKMLHLRSWMACFIPSHDLGIVIDQPLG